MPDIPLIPKAKETLHDGRPDYHVYAGQQLVGRIYQNPFGLWLWSIVEVLFDMSVNRAMHGEVPTLDEAKRQMRARRSTCG